MLKAPLKISSSKGCPEAFRCACYKRYLHTEFYFSFVLKLLHVTFVLAVVKVKPVVAPADSSAKDS
jgi:hypothetical protein